MYRVILKRIGTDERITLADGLINQKLAEERRKMWRRALGNNWKVERRPGLDTLDCLGLTVEKY
jgi:hypothetical protein